jgi:hypothetical protein
MSDGHNFLSFRLYVLGGVEGNSAIVPSRRNYGRVEPGGPHESHSGNHQEPPWLYELRTVESVNVKKNASTVRLFSTFMKSTVILSSTPDAPNSLS